MTEPRKGGESAYRIGIDVGGTFTDVVLIENSTGDVSVAKRLNRHDDRTETVVEAVERLLDPAGVTTEQLGWISHGTTISTNAVIERKGAKTALVTNRNFRDILEIGRFARPPELIYRIHEDKPAPLVPRRLRLGVAGRIDRHGAVVAELDESDLDRAIAVNRRRAGRQRRGVLPLLVPQPGARGKGAGTPPGRASRSRHRAVERNPARVPGVSAYLDHRVRRLRGAGAEGLYLRADPPVGGPRYRLPALHVFQSSGGVATPDVVMRNPALTMLSGPAGAVVGAAQLCGQAGYRDLITMDIGGTSLDTCLVRDSVAEATTTREIDMFPLAIPMLDVHTIGAGGGSVVRVDDVGRVKVGPESMGAKPGPACYGLGGDRATLTDVNLLMGFIDADGFADGEVSLDRARAEAVVEREVARPLGVDIGDAAVGVYRIATAQIAEAIGTVTIERGSDPRDFDLVAFGGGGPLHAAAVARELGVGRVIVPLHPGLFSARGIATADFSHDYIQSVVRPLAEMRVGDAVAIANALTQRADGDLDAEGIPEDRRELSPAFDLRYVGQTTEIAVPLPDGVDSFQDGFAAIEERFHDLHERLYSYRVPGEPIELVNVRLRAVGRVARPPLPAMAGTVATPEPAGERRVRLPDGTEARPVAVYRRDRLAPGASWAGPAIVEEPSSTTLILEGMTATVDAYGNLILALGGGKETS